MSSSRLLLLFLEGRELISPDRAAMLRHRSWDPHELVDSGWLDSAELEETFETLETTRLRCPGCRKRLKPASLELTEDGVACPECQIGFDLRPMIPPPARGRIGRYELLDALGKGGMGAVYRARDTETGQIVALKLLTRIDETAIARFRREAEATRRIRHPNVVSVRDLGFHDGRHFLVMDYVEGITLREWSDETRSEAAIVALMDAVLAGLENAHEAGVVHRDLKPENILIASDGTPKIVDFGLAKDLQAGPMVLTGTRTVVGTPFYMAPEVILHGARTADARADIWSLGIILYELLAGRPPFVARSLANLYRSITKEPLERPPDTSDAVWEALARALRKNPDKRYSSAAEFRQGLVSGRSPSRRPLIFGGAGFCLLLVLGGLLLLFGGGSQREVLEPRIRQLLEEDRAEQGFKEARRWLDEAPDDPVAHLLLGLAAEASDQPELAFRHFDRSAALDPTREARRGRARMLLETGQPEAAAKAFASLAEEASDGTVWAALGRAREESGDERGAIRAYERAVEEGVSPPDLVERLVHLVQKEDPARALQLAKEASFRDPDAPALHALVIEQAIPQGDIESAVTAARAAETLAPDDPVIQYLQARVEYLAGRPDAARKRLLRLKETTPGNADVWRLLTDIQLQAEEYENAEATAQEGLARHPDDASLLFLRGVVRVQREAFDAGARDLEEALPGLGPRLKKQAYRHLARVARQQGRFEKTVGLLDEGIQAFPEAVELIAMRGRIHFTLAVANLKYLTLARQDFERALTLDPDHLDSQKYLVEIQLLQSSKLEEAKKRATRILEQDDTLDSHFLYSRVLRALNQEWHAIKYLGDAIVRFRSGGKLGGATLTNVIETQQQWLDSLQALLDKKPEKMAPGELERLNRILAEMEEMGELEESEKKK